MLRSHKSLARLATEAGDNMTETVLSLDENRKVTNAYVNKA